MSLRFSNAEEEVGAGNGKENERYVLKDQAYQHDILAEVARSLSMGS
jgi:hypothetical protein